MLVARARLYVRAERADGQVIQVGSIGIGEYVGEAALLGRTPAAAHVIAATSADIMLLSAREVLELAGAYPALWAELKDVGERRTREHHQRMRSR
ncbi:MAG: cyclic nucleotide-binding domain-containing protein [Deltaproteobacteria bacterium]|nr:cyclic nucleotide-binding domain-containing protein [Deltaproteobacteria bacterium]